MKMPTDLSKKARSKFAKKDAHKYPSFVGDLPVKIVQDIIDNLAANDDWETVAGKTGVSARAIASLKAKQHTKAEMANIIFEEWLCRIPRPVELANLLLTVNRFADVKRLKNFISPEEWKGVERKMDAKMKSGPPGRPAPPGSAVVSETRVTSVEESSVNYPLRSGRPSEVQSLATSSVTSHSSITSHVVDRRPVTEPRPPIATSSILSETLHSEDFKLPSGMSPPRASSFLNPPVRSAVDEQFEEAETCLTRYSVQLNIFSDTLTQSEDCGRISFTDGNTCKWAVKSFFGRSDPLDCQKFCREIAALVRLRHTHIIPLSGYCFIDNDIRLVYPNLSFGSLESQLTTNPDFKDYGRCICTMMQVASALSYVHSAGFMHGDVSMSNILLDETLHPYLADFEHSVNLRGRYHDTNREARPGTEPYVPSFRSVPNPSPDVDIHAFGILLALVGNQRVWRGGDERGAELVESLFQVRTTPNLQKSHNLLRTLCLRTVQIQDWDMEEIEQQVEYIYKTVLEPECEDPAFEIFPEMFAEPYLVKKATDARVALRNVSELQGDDDSETESDE